MNCGMECIKYLIFIFNFIFALGGLAILVVGVLIQYAANNIVSALENNIKVPLSLPAVVLIVVGAIIFIIAFFGCCGAARESHCMIVTFAVLLLTLLVIQIAVAAYAFINMKDLKAEDINREMKPLFDKYFEKSEEQQTIQAGVNTIQSLATCCGYFSYADYTTNPNNPNPSQVPYSCCGKTEGQYCSVSDVTDREGCKNTVVPLIHKYMNACGGLALGIAAIELIGIIFSFCLANSIRNVERRGYKV